MLLQEWQKFKGWTVLEFFLREQKRIHLKGLAKELAISPRTAQTYLQLYEKEGILRKEEIGNLKLYVLAESYITHELKRAYLLIRIAPFINKFISNNPSISSLVLYGSSARGDYDSNSDIDMLAVSNTKALNMEGIKELEAGIGRETKIEVLTIGEIRRLAGKQDSFYRSVSRNSIQLHGAAI